MSSKDVKQEVTPVEIKGDKNLEQASNIGVEKDELPLGKILTWAGATVVIIAIFFVILPYSFNLADAIKEDQVARNASHYPINDLLESDQKKLTNFGIIDKENGVYHMPVDSAISILAID